MMQTLACIAVKVEAMGNQLDTAKSKWHSRMLPKLQRKDAQRWKARDLHLQKWHEEQSHIKVTTPHQVAFSFPLQKNLEISV